MNKWNKNITKNIRKVLFFKIAFFPILNKIIPVFSIFIYLKNPKLLKI